MLKEKKNTKDNNNIIEFTPLETAPPNGGLSL